MAKFTNILKFISILQFSQMYLIFEINISKEIKKMIANDYKRLQKTSMCINLVCILWVWASLKLLAITLWLQSCCLCSSALMRSPSALGDRPGSRPLTIRILNSNQNWVITTCFAELDIFPVVSSSSVFSNWPHVLLMISIGQKFPLVSAFCSSD